MPEGRVFGLDTQTLVQIGVQLLNAILLAVLLTYVLYKPIKGFLDNRTNRIQSKIEKAEQAQADADELIAEYERKIKEINNERLEIMDEAQLKAEGDRQVLLNKAKEEADEVKRASLERISADRERFEKEMRVQAVDIAYLMAQKFISVNLDNESQEDYFDKMLAQMEETPWTS